MDFIDEVSALASRAEGQVENLQTEEATKNALVLPFINALGYNVFDPMEVVPEYTADVGIKKGEKVDYAIILEGEPIMLFEVKHVGGDLSTDHASQLYRYFSVTPARIGVLTNGRMYRFFSDLEEDNKMDDRPFLEFDLFETRETLVDELKKMRKSSFDLDVMLSTAHDLKYLKAMRGYLARQWNEPSEEFVQFMVKRVYDGLATQSVKEQFKPVVRNALHQFVSGKVSGRLKSALAEEEAVVSEVAASEEPDAPEFSEDDVLTTEEEKEGFRIVRAIMRSVVPPGRVAMRDVKTYCGVLLDDNNRQPICRMHFNTSQKYLGLFGADKKEEKVPIYSLDDMYDYADRLTATVSFYDE